MPYLILGVGLVVGLLLVGRWFVSAKPEEVRKALLWGGATAVLVVAGFFMFTGRAPIAVAVLLGLVPFGIGLLRLGRRPRPPGRSGARNSGWGRSGATSRVRSRYLEMELNHRTGTLDAAVVAGRFGGRRLSDLDHGDLLALLAEVADDPQSQQLLEAYLDRVHGPEWRNWERGGGERRGGAGGKGGGRMTVEEARDILGVGPGASNEEIEAAYRAAIKRNHPDHGGSDWLAAKINEARALLLQR